VISALVVAAIVRVGPGVYHPAFPATPAERDVPVAAFWLDREPVSNADYLAFVAAHPEWRRDRTKPLVADAGYLAQWATASELGTRAPARAPVIHVSWFAARAYCAWRGGRLPVEREWELAAAASETQRDATADPAWAEQILAWYARPTPDVMPPPSGRANAWGVADLHGLVWEWIEDFGAALVDADSRSPMRDQFCGASAATSRDPRAYATFMRIAFRSSLQARFTAANLGFRCAYDRSAS